MRLLAVAFLYVSAAGCIAVVDARYFVRGTVRKEGRARVPIAKATVSVPECVPRANPTEVATTDAEGKFNVECWYGGACLFPVWCPGVKVPDTTIEFASPGHKPQSVRLLGKRADGRVAQRRCDTAKEPSCYELDVTLEPEVRPPGDG